MNRQNNQPRLFLDELVSMPVDIARFGSGVERRGEGECWPWRATAGRADYGRFRFAGRWVAAHRIAWALHHGRDPYGAIIRHSCDYPACCNAKHLLIGTHADNARDKMDRNRWRTGNQCGERNPRSRLTAKQVANIVAALGRGETNVSIARRYPVTHSMVSRIATGRAWTKDAAAIGWPPAVARLAALTAALPHDLEGK